MTPNDTITTTRGNFRGEQKTRNPYARNTPEWAAYEAGFSAGRSGHRNGIERMR